MYNLFYDNNGDARIEFFDKTYNVKDFITNNHKGLFKTISVELFMWQQKKMNNEKGRNLEFTITVDDLVDMTVSDCPITDTYWSEWYLDELYDSRLYKHLPQIDRINNKLGYTPDNIWVIRADWNILKGYWNGKQLEGMFRNGHHYKTVEQQADYFGLDCNVFYDSLTDNNGDSWFNRRFKKMVGLLN